MNRAVFLDSDGVINEISEGQFIKSPAELKLFENSVEGIKLLNSLKLKVIVVTNTPQVARGLCTEKDIENIHMDLKRRLEENGAKVDAFYYCPHHPETYHKDIKPVLMKYRIKCECRKPNIGMIIRAKKDFDIDLKNSFIVGDRTIDIKTGKNAKCRTIMVNTGVAGNDKTYDVTADFVVNDIYDASLLIQNLVNVKTVILVGGRGERLRPLTDTLPKPMLSIKGKPLLQYLVGINKVSGITNIIMSGHYLFDKIKEYFEDGSKFGVKIEYVDDGNKPLGSGGALRNCSNLLPENFIVMSGDVFTNIDIWELLKFHFRKNSIATLVVRKTDHPYDSDLIELDEDFRAVKFYSKKNIKKIGDIANTSLFVFKKEIISFINGKKPNLESDVISKIIQLGNVYCYLNTKYIVKDIGTIERYNNIK